MPQNSKLVKPLRVIYEFSFFIFNYVHLRCRVDRRPKVAQKRASRTNIFMTNNCQENSNLSYKKDFYSKHSLEQSKCLIKLKIHESFTISGSSLCSKYSSIKWAIKCIAYRTFLCFKCYHRGKSFCKTYILHLPQESGSGNKIQWRITLITPSAKFSC